MCWFEFSKQLSILQKSWSSMGLFSFQMIANTSLPFSLILTQERGLARGPYLVIYCGWRNYHSM